ncbi:hypothetical protein F8388_016819 [Cannabis sativa]|uniref:NB-ARC domain-containing protein n=1 Tax=Cannabis sativa TaxID=3483 RepID=A0A7J6ETN4_CANSA|nr:hypothetical protein F8388_016819 [Cannabis sativa]
MGSSSVKRNRGSLWDAIMEFRDLEDTVLEVKDALFLHSDKEMAESEIFKILLMRVEDVLYRGGDLADEIFPMAMQRRNMLWSKKHYLLILDGVCDELAKIWGDLRELLSVGANGSRIIVTTRSSDIVAKIACGKLLWELNSLNEDESWSLFVKMAFEPGPPPTDPVVMEIGREIVKKWIQVLPSSIGELMHLRYLDLSQNVNMETLPKSISRLRNLQTLKLNRCSNLRTLPRGITKLVRLRSLENKSCYCLTYMPKGFSKLVDLRKVSEFVLSIGTDSVSNQSGKLDELKELDHLRGQLKIKNLKFPEGDKTAEARLYNKPHLSSLLLIWDIDDSVQPAHCEKSLQDLQPHSNIEKLSLSTYGGVEFSDKLSMLTNLVELSLLNCMNCRCLPPLDCFPRLRVLVMDKLTQLEYISNKQIKNESLTCLPSLNELRLTDLPKLKRWWKDASDFNEEMTMFPCLSKLIVEDCPNLTSMPLFPSLEELLVLKNTSWKPFQLTVSALKRSLSTTEIEVSSSLSSSNYSTSAPLSKLDTLHILHMRSGEPIMWQALCSLRSLTFHHIVDIDHLFEGLEQVTSLQQLHIWHCDSLREIPHWISNPVSLKTLSIKACPNLTIRPDRMSFITSLKVEIEDCPGDAAAVAFSCSIDHCKE